MTFKLSMASKGNVVVKDAVDLLLMREQSRFTEIFAAEKLTESLIYS